LLTRQEVGEALGELQITGRKRHAAAPSSAIRDRRVGHVRRESFGGVDAFELLPEVDERFCVVGYVMLSEVRPTARSPRGRGVARPCGLRRCGRLPMPSRQEQDEAMA